MIQFLRKQKRKELINLIDEIIEDYKLLIPYAILNEKIDLEGYKDKNINIRKNIHKLRIIRKELSNYDK